MIITKLDKIGKRLRATRESLSALQRSLLVEGLFAWYRSRPLDAALDLADPGHFSLKELMSALRDRRER